MKQILLLLIALIITSSAIADDSAPSYESRYAKWLPFATSTIKVTIGIRRDIVPSDGLLYGVFSAHHYLREPHARRLDGTPLGASSLILEDEMISVLRLIDSLGPHAIFSTYRGDNWQDPRGETGYIRVVWHEKHVGYTYDWYLLTQEQMNEVLHQLRTLLITREAVEIIDGLLDGNKESGEQDNEPTPDTRVDAVE